MENSLWNLPVYSEKHRILEVLEGEQVLVVESPTGSGKTTGLPVILLEAGYAKKGLIGVTQPRRIAAMSVCNFIARHMDSEVGGLVGYKMRFEDVTSSDTKLKIITDGTLLQEMKGDRWLSRYDVLIIDEAHERTLNIDFILGLLKGILPHRLELKVIISSATLNPHTFSDYFDGAPIVTIDTPVYPVHLCYDPPPIEGNEDMLIDKIVAKVERIAAIGNPEKEDVPSGDILIFCSGEKMIKDTVAKLVTCSVRGQLLVMPLYARLGSEEQEKVFEAAPEKKIKVVVATNIAETSVTIDGITAVIDTGLVKLNFYDPHTYTSSLSETEISKASANQREGRAGRTQPGICYRLYSEASYNRKPKFTKEDIYRTDLAEVVLRMAEIGIKDFEAFPFISAPKGGGIRGAVAALRLLDALDLDDELTDIGQRMVPYPLLPRHSRMIIESILRYPDVIREVIILAAFLSTNSPYLLPRGEEMEARKAHHKFRSEHHGDFASYLNLFGDYTEARDRQKFAEAHYLDKKILDEIVAIADQLEEITERNSISISGGGANENFIKACARGLIPFICVRDRRFDYRSVGADHILIHPGSVLFKETPEFIIAGEIVRTSRTYARSVSPLQKAWLPDIHPKLPKWLSVRGGTRFGSNWRREKGAGESVPRKDTTNQIWIAGEGFKLLRNSGRRSKRRALIQWDRLHAALAKTRDAALPDFGSMQGTLLLGNDEVLPNSKVNTIIKAVNLLDPKKDLIEAAPRGNFHIDTRLDDLIDELPNLLKVTRKNKRRKKGGMGFVTLYSDGRGHFWFRSLKSFHGAISTCLESLESLADYMKTDSHKSQKTKLGDTYRQIESLLY